MNAREPDALLGEPLREARARHRRRVIGQPFDREHAVRREALVAGYVAGRFGLYDLPADLQPRALQVQLDARIAAARAANGEK